MELNPPYSETELFEKISAGDEEAFEKIFHSYNRQLYPYILSLVKSAEDAKEIVQEVFLKLWLRRETLAAVENPGGWIFTVASHAAYDHLRKTASYELKLSNFRENASMEDDEFWRNIDLKETRSFIEEAVRRLPFRRRQIFQMIKIEGLSRKEVADALSVSENTVRNQLGEAMDFVRAYLKTKNIILLLPVCLFFVGQ